MDVSNPWRGGFVGGQVLVNTKAKTWTVIFSGEIDKKQVFNSKTGALQWRSTWSDKHGKTRNRWRYYEGNLKTTEIDVGKGRRVLCDTSLFKEGLSTYLWFCDPPTRVRTTGQLITSVGRTNSVSRKQRVDVPPGTIVSMLAMVRSDLSTPRFMKQEDKNICDCRRTNVRSVQETQRYRSRTNRYTRAMSLPQETATPTSEVDIMEVLRIISARKKTRTSGVSKAVTLC